ncbi:MAG: single-stranded DNA-binding protein [Spirochaetota bacterium]
MAYSDLNSVVLIGRLTADPKSDQLPTGTTKASFSLANNYYGANKTNDVNFFDIVAFGKLADTCNTYLKKGKQIAVRGTLRQQRWQDKQSGGNRSRIEIIINDMQMLGAKGEGGGSSGEGAAPADAQSNAAGGATGNATSAASSNAASAGEGFNDDEVPF